MAAEKAVAANGGDAQAAEFRKQADQGLSRVGIFGAILVVSHLLNIMPTEVSALGAKVILKDPIVLRGALAVLFLNSFFLAIINGRYAAAYSPYGDANRTLARAALRRYQRTGRKVRDVKTFTKLELISWGLFFTPWATVFAFFYLAALVLSIADIRGLVTYCYDETAAGKLLHQLVRDLS